MPTQGTLSRMMRQTATHWVSTGFNKHGDASFNAPVDIAVRWEKRTEQLIDENGDKFYTRAIVYSLTSIAVGDYLYLGSKTDTNPEDVTGADKVRRIEGVPDHGGTLFLYKALL